MRINRYLGVTGVVLLNALVVQQSHAADWKIKPEISLREVYSDNILLDSTDEESDLITEISPRLVVAADGNRADWQFDYRLQNLVYSDNSDRNNSNHRLNTSLQTELVEDWVFFDAVGKVSQQLVDIRDGLSRDRISGSQNAEDVYAYSLTPYITPRFGDYIESKISYTFDYVDSENDNGNNRRTNDSEGDRINAFIRNGSATGNLFWNISYDSREIDYSDGDRTDTELLRGTIGLKLTRYWSINISGTDENNEFLGNRGDNDPDDSFYGAGVTWSPSRNFDLSVGYNKRTDARPDEDDNFGSGSLKWTPTPRTEISAQYGNRFFGETYDFTFNHRMRRSSWQASYRESVSDFREQILDQQLIGALICPIGSDNFQQCRIFNSDEPPGVDEQVVGIVGTIASISNNTFISKKLNASWSIRGNRNVITLGMANERREFVGDGENERELDIRLSWSYQIAPKTVSLFTITQGETEFEDGEENQDLSFRWSLSKNIASKSRLSLELYYSDRDADTRGRDYTENRVTLSFQHFF